MKPPRKSLRATYTKAEMQPTEVNIFEEMGWNAWPGGLKRTSFFGGDMNRYSWRKMADKYYGKLEPDEYDNNMKYVELVSGKDDGDFRYPYNVQIGVWMIRAYKSGASKRDKKSHQYLSEPLFRSSAGRSFNRPGGMCRDLASCPTHHYKEHKTDLSVFKRSRKFAALDVRSKKYAKIGPKAMLERVMVVQTRKKEDIRLQKQRLAHFNDEGSSHSHITGNKRGRAVLGEVQCADEPLVKLRKRFNAGDAGALAAFQKERMELLEKDQEKRRLDAEKKHMLKKSILKQQKRDLFAGVNSLFQLNQEYGKEEMLVTDDKENREVERRVIGFKVFKSSQVLTGVLSTVDVSANQKMGALQSIANVQQLVFSNKLGCSKKMMTEICLLNMELGCIEM